MPKRKAVKPEHVEWKRAQAFFDFLKEVNEKTWQSSTEDFIRAWGGSEEQTTNHAQWFSNPAIYNNDGSNQVKAETILNFSGLFRRTIKSLSESEDPARALYPILFLTFSLIPKEFIWDIPKLLLTEISNREKDSEFKNRMESLWGKISWGILDQIAVELFFLLASLYQQHKIGVCRLETCQKFFIKGRKTQRYCSEAHRKLDWKRQHVYPKTQQNPS